MKKLLFFLFLIFPSACYAQISTTAYSTPDDVSITTLETNRQTFQNAINNFDGALIQDATITADKLDANTNPENRWDETFSDYVYNGLLPIYEAGDLTLTTSAGVAYIYGTRVEKSAVNKTYTASRHTYVDLSNTGVYTYQEVTTGAAEPSVSANSIRLARVSTGSVEVAEVRDDRTLTLSSVASANQIIDTGGQTGIQTEETAGENILRFDTAGSEQIIIRDGYILPTLDNDIDLGDSTHEFKNLYIDGTADIATEIVASSTITSLSATSITSSLTAFPEINSATATAGRIFVSDGTDFESMQLTGDATINTAGYLDVTTSTGSWTLVDYDDINGIDLGAGDVDYTITLSNRVEYRALLDVYVIADNGSRTLSAIDLELTAAGTHTGITLSDTFTVAGSRTDNNVVDAAAASLTFANNGADLSYDTTETVNINIDVKFMLVATNKVIYSGTCKVFGTNSNDIIYDEQFSGQTSDDDGVIDFYLTHSSAADARVYGGRWIWSANTQ